MNELEFIVKFIERTLKEHNEKVYNDFKLKTIKCDKNSGKNN